MKSDAVQPHTAFLSVITRTMEPRPPAATACRVEGRCTPVPPSPCEADLVMPREQDTAGVLCRVGKTPVEVLHEHIHLLIGEALHCLLYICCFEPRQNIQHYTKVPLLHMYT